MALTHFRHKFYECVAAPPPLGATIFMAINVEQAVLAWSTLRMSNLIFALPRIEF